MHVVPCDEELEHCSPIAVKESAGFQETSSLKN